MSKLHEIELPAAPAAAPPILPAGATAAPSEPILPLAAAPAGTSSSPGEIAELLERTSRTFALAIPLLPEPTRLQVGIAYLLFRIADTFEDAELWPRETKLSALASFERLLRRAAPDEARREADRWLAAPPCADAGYLELLRQTPAVLGAFWLLDEGPRQLIGEHTRRTVEGMARFVRRATAGGELELADLDDLKGYCYVVAGIVGEMLTELFLVGRRALAPVRGFLRQRSASFGEALQLVNIIKDSLADAGHGRRFLPPGSNLAEIVALARQDLAVAMRYTLGLQRAGAPRGIVAFAALPVRLAQATLDIIEQRGPGVKLSRPDVSRIVAALDLALDQGLPAV
ncbi:MAG: squalene/phytoene synthase family protein [Acidobacteria bacterium]|nr:squalene/phytoene synthase family protein [Acidobacteriota bacterium]